MKTALVAVAVVLVVVGVVGGVAWVVIPTTYENERGMLIVRYRLSDTKCLHMRHDGLGQFPILCAEKDYNESVFAPKKKLTAK